MDKNIIRVYNGVVYGGPALAVPAHMSFGQYVIDRLREIIEKEENRVALINGDTGEQYAYKQILQDVVNVATGLKKIGVKRGDVMALYSENRNEYIPAALGAICCGATITTANVQYTKEELTHVLSISRPNIIFCSEEALEQNLKTLKSSKFIKKIIQFGDKVAEKGIISFNSLISPADVNEFEADEVDGSDTLFILYSSGTTGLPKGVMLSHLNALYAAANFDLDASRTDKDTSEYERLLTLVPWYHAYGLMSTLNNLTIGAIAVYFATFDPIKYLTAIQEHKVNVLLMVPPLVVFIAKAPFIEEFDMSSVKSVWCGAAPLSAETIDTAMKRLPNCTGIYQAYGMTETSLAATKDTDRVDTKPKPGSGGIPLRGVKAKVVDIETRIKLGPKERGEICLKGPIIMKGYAGNKVATQNMLDEEGYLKTGDIGYYDEEGYFFIVDRLKELIKYKGSQVPPAEVENVVLQHSAVAECGVVGAPDERAGELPTAFVCLKPGAVATEQELLDFTNTRLSPEKRLRGGIIFVYDIPKNPSGKILRRQLKEQLKKHKKSKL